MEAKKHVTSVCFPINDWHARTKKLIDGSNEGKMIGADEWSRTDQSTFIEIKSHLLLKNNT